MQLLHHSSWIDRYHGKLHKITEYIPWELRPKTLGLMATAGELATEAMEQREGAKPLNS